MKHRSIVRRPSGKRASHRETYYDDSNSARGSKPSSFQVAHEGVAEHNRLLLDFKIHQARNYPAYLHRNLTAAKSGSVSIDETHSWDETRA